MNIDDIQAFLAQQDLDIRKTVERRKRTGITPRFIDQKCTPDVLQSCAIWITALPKDQQQSGFTGRTIWDSKAFSNEVRDEFSKPDVKERSGSSEFDKFISQPLKTLVYAGVLSDRKDGRRIVYKTETPEILDFIAAGYRNARGFLTLFIEETLRQSGLMVYFNDFLQEEQTNATYCRLRDQFTKFMKNCTLINGDLEIRRIFPKVLNPLAHNLGRHGAISGRMSRHPITTSDLYYNRKNARDKNKQKSQTRSQARRTKPMPFSSEVEIKKAMNAVRKRHRKQSELIDAFANGEATQVHHIFPQSTFPQLAAIPENLILLTGTQHNTKAHPHNRTAIIEFDYQIECLIAKLQSVKDSIASGDGFYDLNRLISVINIGYPDILVSPNTTPESLAKTLRHYQNGICGTWHPSEIN